MSMPHRRRGGRPHGARESLMKGEKTSRGGKVRDEISRKKKHTISRRPGAVCVRTFEVEDAFAYREKD